MKCGFRVQGSGFRVHGACVGGEGRGCSAKMASPSPPPSPHPTTHTRTKFTRRKCLQTPTSETNTRAHMRILRMQQPMSTPAAPPPCCSHHSHPRGPHKACPARCELPAPSAPSARGGTGTQLRDPDPPTRTADSSLNCAAPARWGKCTCCCIKDGTRTRTRTATHTDTDTTRCVALGTTQQGERVARLWRAWMEARASVVHSRPHHRAGQLSRHSPNPVGRFPAAAKLSARHVKVPLLGHQEVVQHGALGRCVSAGTEATGHWPPSSHSTTSTSTGTHGTHTCARCSTIS